MDKTNVEHIEISLSTESIYHLAISAIFTAIAVALVSAIINKVV